MVENNLKNKKGFEILQDPELNKSTAFSSEEQESLGLVGLVPDTIESEDLQLKRVMMQLGKKNSDLERYIYLINFLLQTYQKLPEEQQRSEMFKLLYYDPTNFYFHIRRCPFNNLCSKNALLQFFASSSWPCLRLCLWPCLDHPGRERVRGVCSAVGH